MDYTEISPVVKITRHATCPWCQAASESPVDHLIEQETQTVWYCDNCGESYGLMFHLGKMWTAKVPNRRCDDIAILLRHDDIGLIVKGMEFSDSPGGHAYFYDEGTCPTNYLKDVIRIIDLKTDDTDPHGIFKFVGTRPYSPALDDPNLSASDLAAFLSQFKIDRV